MITRSQQARLLSESDLRLAFEHDGMEAYKAKRRAEKIIEARRRKGYY